MKKLLLILLLFVGGISASAQEQKRSFSMEEAVSYALQHNRKAINAEQDIEAAKKQKWETIAGGLPQIDAQIDYKNFIEKQKSLLPAEILGGKPGEFAEIAFGTKENINAKATLSQLIFDGSYIVGVQSAKVYMQISKLAKRKTETELRKAVVDAYTNVLLSEESIRVLEKNKSVLEENLKDSQKIFENGLGEEESVEQLQITLANVKNNLNNTKRLHDVAKKMLNIILGIDINEQITLTDSLDKLVNKVVTDAFLDDETFNYTENIDYKIAENQAISQRLLLRNEKAKYLPTLSAFINAGYDGFSDDGFTFHKKDQKWHGSALVGVGLKIPIFSSWKRGARVQRYQIELEKAKNNLTQTQQELMLKYESAKSNYQFSIEQYETFKENLALAERIERKNQIKYTEGLASSFDLRQAQIQLYSAQQEYLQSIVNVLNKKEELKAITKTK